MKFISTLAVAGAMASVASAFVSPAEPIGESVWKPGTTVNITWLDDKSYPSLADGPLFNMLLMTGADQNQIELKKIAENIKGAAGGGSFQYTVDYVDPPGKIYFLKFVHTMSNGTEILAWSTRFHITDANGVKSSLEPSAASGQNSGGVGKLLPPPTAAATTTASSDPKATTASNPNSSAGAFKISSVAAAVAGFVGAAALTFF